MLDLRREHNLDLLGLDDQISTSRSPGAWAACQRLGDLLAQWYGERINGIAYRPRTTPSSSTNLAFFSHAGLSVVDHRPLGQHRLLVEAAIVGDGFAVEGWVP